MLFGEQLKSSLNPEYSFYYITYDELKSVLSRGTENNAQWSELKEQDFLKLLMEQLDKVHDFTKLKTNEINRRLKDANSLIHSTVGRVESDFPPSSEEFMLLDQELNDIITAVYDLDKFAKLNYTGFQKIVKKHDKLTGYICRPVFQSVLYSKPFFKIDVEPMLVKISILNNLIQTKGAPAGDSSAGGSQQNFVRQTTKYWVHPDDILAVKLFILKQLPILVFDPNKEYEAADSAITSIYYDNKGMDLYNGRLRKDEGAEAIRLRWYGGMNSDTIFVERKTHREDWTGEKSVKARFPLKEKKVNDFMKGNYTVPQAFERMRRDGKKSIKEIESLEALANEVQYTVIKDKLRPVMRSFYNRTAFQLSGDARVRISLDTELTMVREDNFDSVDRTKGNWRRMDIGIDYPFDQLPEGDVERFPYAVLEVKLQTQLGQEPPDWVRRLVSSHLVEAVPKFSKFIHGTATLLPERVTLLPFWYPQMNIDIRKPKIVDISIPGSSADIGYGGGMDEEEFVGGISNSYNSTNNHVRFVNDTSNATEATSLLLPSSTINQRDYKSSQFQKFWKNLKKALDFTDDRTFAAKPGIDYDLTKNFKVPDGKSICIPVRIEPKVYFANERTFLSWLSIGLILGTTSTTLLNYGDIVSITSAIGFFITAILTIVYATSMYIWRIINIRQKKPANYGDKYGPTAICICFGCSTIVTFLLKYLKE